MNKPNASTVSSELSRQHSQQVGKSIHRSLQQKLGTIVEVHDELPMVKVVFNDDIVAAGGDWIPVGHSVLDIIHRFGALRSGLRVLVTFAGEVEASAIATIVGVENEKLGNEIQEINDIETSAYGLCAPGMGI